MTGFPLQLPLDVTAPRQFAVLQRSLADDFDAPLYRVEIELLNLSELSAMRRFVDRMRTVKTEFRTRRVPV